MTITGEQIKAVAMRMCELNGYEPHALDGAGNETWKAWRVSARKVLIERQAIRDVMGSGDDA